MTRIFLLALLALSFALASAPVADAQAPFSRYNVRGDNLRRVQSENGPVNVLSGNVSIDGPDLRATADSAKGFENLEQYLLIGHVEVVTESLSIWSQRLRLYQATDAAVASGNVRVRTVEGSLGSADRGYYRKRSDQLALAGSAQLIDGATVIHADSLHIDRPAQILKAFGSVKMVDPVRQMVIEGEHGIIDQSRGEAIVDSLPRLRSRQKGGEETEVEGKIMGFALDGSSSWAQGDVIFRQGATRATADSAHFAGEDALELYGSPRVAQEGRVMTGQRIRFLYAAGELAEIEVFGDAKLVDATPDSLGALYQNIPLANEIEGDSLRIFVSGNEIQRTLVWGTARSVYLPEDQSSTLATNTVSGDRIDIRFGNSGVNTVDVQGSVEGEYRFLELASLRPDSAATDSLVALPDSLSSRPDFAARAQTVIYRGSSTKFDVAKGTIHIHEKARIEYGTLELDAVDIWFDTGQRELRAEGLPELVDKDSRLVGDRMGYLFEAGSGAVADGATRMDDGFYGGEHIRRLGDETLLVENGSYSTCDLSSPHYHFKAKRMKLRLGDSVAARQITFYISDIPLFTLPFYFKSLQEGRRSGILFPRVNVGISSREGRYVRDIGYYWATNDYTDFRFELDYNERQQSTFTIANRYNVRYRMSGDVRLDYLKRFSETTSGDEWRLEARHNQPKLWDVWNATSRLSLSSSSLTVNNLSGEQRNDLLDTQLHSTASLSRSFDNGSRLALSATRDQFVNAADDDPVNTDNVLVRQTLPSFSLGFRTRPLVQPLPGGRDGNFFVDILRDIQFSRSLRGSWEREEREESQLDRYSANAGIGLSYAPDGRLGPFIYTSSVDFSERFRREDREATLWADSTLIGGQSEDEIVYYVSERTSSSQEDFLESLSIRNSLRTDLYGIFDLGLGPVRGMKHKLSWDMGHSWSPSFVSGQAGNQNFNFGLRNAFSFKYRSGEANADGTEPTKKLEQLIAWDLGSSYDPDSDPGDRWSDIRSSVNIRPGVTQAISLDLSQTIDPYSFRVRNTSLSSNLRLQGEFKLGGDLLRPEEPRNILLERLPGEKDSTATDEEWDSGFSDRQLLPAEKLEAVGGNVIPWNFGARFTLNRTTNLDSGATTRRATVSLSSGLRLPGDWQFSYSSGLDLEAGEFTNSRWSANRDLHCWRLEFYRGVADGTDFGFSLYLLDIPDIRVDRGNRGGADLISRGGGLF